MNHTHVIAFLIGAIVHALFSIGFQWLERSREIRDARVLRRRLDAENIFQQHNSVPTVPPPIRGSHLGRT